MKKVFLLLIVSLLCLTSCDLLNLKPKKEISAEEIKFENRLDKDGPLTQGCFPSIGKPKILVIPINLEPTKATKENLKDIKTAFCGTEEETGFESVKTYYYKSSYGKLDIEVTMLDEWFTPSYSKLYYQKYYDNEGNDGSIVILHEALKHYNSKIDFTDYDLNNDGYIDAVWLIYNCPVDYETADFYWAFTNWDYSEKKYDGKMIYSYAFGGTDFMHQTAEEAYFYDPTDILVDAHTYIHETGHLLGLDDYYDYDFDIGPEGGLYGADMMDFNIGDHAPISKLLLGWVTPTVVTGVGTIELSLESFTKTGQFLIIADHELKSIYDEYYIIEYYTNDGLNSHDKPFSDDQIGGIRVTKIRAQKNTFYGKVVLNNGDYATGFKYDNSDEKELFIDMIAESEIIYFDYYSLDIECLFQAGERLNNKTVFFTMQVLSLDETGCSVVITIE